MTPGLRSQLEAARTLPARAFVSGLMSGFFVGCGLLMLLQGRPWLAAIAAVAAVILAGVGCWIMALDRFDPTSLLEGRHAVADPAADLPHPPRV